MAPRVEIGAILNWLVQGMNILQLKAIHPEVGCLPSLHLNIAENLQFFKFMNESQTFQKSASHTTVSAWC